MIVTREYIISLLRAWQEGIITAYQVYNTTDHLNSEEDVKFIDLEGKNENNITADTITLSKRYGYRSCNRRGHSSLHRVFKHQVW